MPAGGQLLLAVAALPHGLDGSAPLSAASMSHRLGAKCPIHSLPSLYAVLCCRKSLPLTSQCAPARLAGSSAHHAQTARLVPGQHPAPPGSCAQIPIVLQDIVLKSRPCLFGAATIPPSKEYGKLACPGSPGSLSRQEVCAGSMRTSEKKVSEEAKRRRKDSWLSFYLLPSLNPLT